MGNIRAWRARDLDAADRIHEFSTAAQTEVLDYVVSLPPYDDIEHIRVDRSAVPIFAREVIGRLDDLDGGVGFVIFSRVRGLSREQHRVLSWMISNVLGSPEAQDQEGRRRYQVYDRGGNRTLLQGARYHQTRQGGDFHTDNMQVREFPLYLGLSCVASAMLGGESILVSGFTVHELLERVSHDLETLSRPFLWEQRGVSGVYEAPLITYDHAGDPHFRYQRAYLEAAHAKAGQPLTRQQIGALNTLDAIFELSEVQFRGTLSAGQMVVFNDTQVFHARTPFIDYNEPTEAYDYGLEPGNRLMERTWITRRPA